MFALVAAMQSRLYAVKEVRVNNTFVTGADYPAAVLIACETLVKGIGEYFVHTVVVRGATDRLNLKTYIVLPPLPTFHLRYGGDASAAS